MGAWGAIIMGFFGSVFAALTLSVQYHVGAVALLLPFVGFAAVALAAAQVLRLPGTGLVPSPQASRAIMWSSSAEGIGIFLAANIVVNLHRPDLILPAIALVVGLHFLPIAFVAPLRPFYWLGAALILAAGIGFIAPSSIGGAVAGAASALSLWLAAILAIRRDWRAKIASGSSLQVSGA